MKLDEYLTLTHEGLSANRSVARERMQSVVRALDVASMTKGAILHAVDQHRPTVPGHRPEVRAWNKERLLLHAALDETFKLDPPNDEDRAACAVALDLVEMGRIDEAKKLLAEQAPRRLNKICPACGEYAGWPCKDVELKSRDVTLDHYRNMGAPAFVTTETYHVRVERIVPHESRLL